MSPESAPEIVMDANGNYWRRYPDGTLSMAPTSTDNAPVAYPLVVYRRAGTENVMPTEDTP